MTKGRWIAFAVICVAVFGVLILNNKGSGVDVSKIDPSKVITNNDPLPDHVSGSSSDKVVLIQYGDFQCPACGNLYPIITPLTDYYKNQLTFVFRDFPLTSLHPNALAAATAAEAAGLQGKFWQMHHILYENQAQWSNLDANSRTAQFVAYAKQIGANTTQFQKDLNNPKVAKKIERDQALGAKINVSATPTLVLNGQTLDQSKWQTGQILENTIRAAIKASGQTLPPVMPQTQASA